MKIIPFHIWRLSPRGIVSNRNRIQIEPPFHLRRLQVVAMHCTCWLCRASERFARGRNVMRVLFVVGIIVIRELAGGGGMGEMEMTKHVLRALAVSAVQSVALQLARQSV